MSIRRVAITTGDTDGIGAEVAAKALSALGPNRSVQFILWRSKEMSAALLRRLDRIFDRQTFSSFDEALAMGGRAKRNVLIDICSPLDPPTWVEGAARACMAGSCCALVTGPLSKTSINKCDSHALGHTEILSRLTGRKSLFMAFLGRKFNVVLSTGHRPLQTVATSLSGSLLDTVLTEALRLREKLSPAQRRLPVGVLGLNPHSGEGGLIGREEVDWLIPWLNEKRSMKLPVIGPLVPDSAFLTMSAKCSVFIALYHDQGLIPFKLVHGFSEGVHLTLGLPFVRTSVDHGTAKDLFGKNCARHGSMREAISWAIHLTKSFKNN